MDYTLPDVAADYRAPTPSAAAEAVAPVLRDLTHAVRVLWERQERGIRTRIDRVQRQVTGHCGAMTLLLFRVQRYSQQLDDATDRLRTSLRRPLSTGFYRQAMKAWCPDNKIGAHLMLIPQLIKRLKECIHGRLAFRRERTRVLVASLESLSPFAILVRGYSIAQTIPDGKIIRRASDVSVDEEV